MRFKFMLIAVVMLSAGMQASHAGDNFGGGDPYWLLLHEPAVHDELKLTTVQRQSFRKFLDGLDLRFLPLRNKSAADSQAGLDKLKAEAAQQLKALLQPAQAKRLNEVLLWRIGISSLLRDDVATRMRYSETQRKKIKEILDETQSAVTALEQGVSKGESREQAQKKYNELKSDEQTRINKLLKPDQRTASKDLLGKPFDVSRLGNAEFKAPELVDSQEWINSSPLALEKLRGKVVVVHFYACGCINCIHNYPWYQEWSDRYEGKDVVLIGIHTPETDSERQIDQVRQKANEAKFAFPVLIDVKSENWNAWGNSMWPTVYVIDKRGYLRSYWQGELKWQGNDGEKYIREVIELLRSERERNS